MAAISRNPQNTNSLVANKFQVSFTRLPNTTYFCQSATLPGLTIGEAIKPTPFIDLYSPGDKLIYDSLTFTFMVDEDLKSWKELHDWMRAMTFPTDFKEYRDLPNLNRFAKKPFPQFADATLSLLTSSYNHNYKIKFYDCFPIALSSIIFSASDSPDNVLTADATFRFAYYDIEKV